MPKFRKKPLVIERHMVRTSGGEGGMRTDDSIADDRANWLVDAVATATQDRRFLRGDDGEDKVATEALYMNARRAILTALDWSRETPVYIPTQPKKEASNV